MRPGGRMTHLSSVALVAAIAVASACVESVAGPEGDPSIAMEGDAGPSMLCPGEIPSCVDDLGVERCDGTAGFLRCEGDTLQRCTCAAGDFVDCAPCAWSEDGAGVEEPDPEPDPGPADASEPIVDERPPPDCPMRSEVVVYNQSGWGVLADAIRRDASRCGEYWFSIPSLAGDKTTPRAGGQAAAMRARGERFHAAAEFHWHGWAAAPGSWYEKGVEFRRRMEAAGYDVTAGDTWAINELPSSVRRDRTMRRAVRDVVRGLYEGPPGAPDVRGIVFIIGMGHRTVNLSVYEPQIRDWLTDAVFWADMNRTVRFWAQEVYADPAHTCVPGASTGLQSRYLNEYTMHLVRGAVAGPAGAATARDYLRRAYVPLMNAAWRSDVYRTNVSLTTMKHFVSQQTYSARAWASSHLYPDGRVGFAWARYDVDSMQFADVAARLASALHHAYDEGGGRASGACSPSGAYTWCQCRVSGASFNPAWRTFDTW